MNPKDTDLTKHLLPSWFMIWLFEFDSWTLLKNGDFQVFTFILSTVLEIRAKGNALKGV